MSLNHWLIWALLSALFAALTSILSKAGLEKIAPDYAVMFRTAIIAVLVLGFVIATGGWQNPLKLPAWSAGLLALSAVGTCASWVCYYRALKLGDASKVDPIDKSSVLLVAIFALAFLGERLSSIQWLGVGCVGLGAMLLAWKS